MSQKPLGTCSYCKEQVQAEIIESNNLRRDRCECTNCHSTVYVCRSPGCHNFALGGEFYDHELCFACTAATIGVASTVGVVVATVAVAAAGAIVSKRDGGGSDS